MQPSSERLRCHSFRGPQPRIRKHRKIKMQIWQMNVWMHWMLFVLNALRLSVCLECIGCSSDQIQNLNNFRQIETYETSLRRGPVHCKICIFLISTRVKKFTLHKNWRGKIHPPLPEKSGPPPLGWRSLPCPPMITAHLPSLFEVLRWACKLAFHACEKGIW